MHKLIKMILAAFVCFTLIACGARKKEVNVVKDGTFYEYANVNFTYPNSFKVQEASNQITDELSKDGTKFVVQKDDEEISMMIDALIENNKVEELIELFRVEIETTGATIVSNTKVTLGNGDSCYEIVSQNDTHKAKYLVIFEEGKRYCLKYKATISDFDDQIIDMDKFLYTFTVKETGD